MTDPAAGAQDGPVMDQNRASSDDKLRGIVAQVRADLGTGADPELVSQVLRERLQQSGVPFDEAVLADAVARVREGA